jgi:hypothetical protein
VSERSIKRLLAAVPADRDAEERAWRIVRAAYAEHEPVHARPPLRFGLAAAALLCAVAAAAFSPPGRAVVDAVRRTIGVEHAAPALFRLPASGRLLVSGSGGTWLVAADGSKRLLGDYAQASWSPHALFVVASTSTELATLEPRDGAVHWSLARPQIAFPRWGGSRTDTRVAYLTAGRLHVVGGDGKGDARLAGFPPAAPVAPAWQPGDRHVLAYVTTTGRVTVLNPDEGTVAWISPRHAQPRDLVWSPDGKTLVLATARKLVSFDARTGRSHTLALAGTRAAAFSPQGRLAVLRGATVLLVEGARTHRLFAAPARLAGLAWSPNGRWLLTTLPAADQWIFVSGTRVLAVSHIARQFGGVPKLDGWRPGA